MKIEYFNESNFIIFLNKYYVKDLDINEKKSVENYFKKIFYTLRNTYHFDISGYYNIKVYINDQYGMVVVVYKLSNDFYKLYNNKIDMKIVIDKESPFLYETENYFIVDKIKDKVKHVYYKDGLYYIELEGEITEGLYSYLLENSKLIYNDEVDNILSAGTII